MTVQLRHVVEGVGRNARYCTYGPIETATTDAAGRYSFAGYWPGDCYGTQVAADGFTEGEAKAIVGEAGEVREFPDVRLVRVNHSVSGRVIGTGGRLRGPNSSAWAGRPGSPRRPPPTAPLP